MTVAGDTAGAVAGAILIGGRSTRLGRDKALEPLDGRPLGGIVLEVLRAAGCAPVVAVGARSIEREALGVEIVPDRWPGTGPLNGVATALATLGGPVVVAACDLVGLRPTTVARVIAGADEVDVAMATAAGRHGAVGCWNPSALAGIETAFASGIRSLWAVLERLETRLVEVPATELIDIDTDEDLLRHRRSVGC